MRSELLLGAGPRLPIDPPGVGSPPGASGPTCECWFAGALSAGDVALIVALQVDPELGRRAEVPREPQRRVCGDPPPAVHDLVDPPGRDADRHGELVLRDAEALDEVLHEDLTRVNRLDPVSGSQRPAPPLAQRRSTVRRSAEKRSTDE